MAAGITIYGEITITVSDDYRPHAIADDGKIYNIHKSSFMKNAGDTKVRRYVKSGMKFLCEII